MGYVKAQCPNCGGQLEVDSEKEAAVCKFCQGAFIIEKAINNYNIQHNYNTTQNIVKNIYGREQPESEDYLKNGDVFLSINDYEKAQTAYQKAVDLNPSDYRGWLGLAKCLSGNFSKTNLLFFKFFKLKYLNENFDSIERNFNILTTKNFASNIEYLIGFLDLASNSDNLFADCDKLVRSFSIVLKKLDGIDSKDFDVKLLEKLDTMFYYINTSFADEAKKARDDYQKAIILGAGQLLFKTINALINLISNYLAFINNIDSALKVANDEQKKIINQTYESYYQKCKQKFDSYSRTMSYGIKKSADEYFDNSNKNSSQKVKAPRKIFMFNMLGVISLIGIIVIGVLAGGIIGYLIEPKYTFHLAVVGGIVGIALGIAAKNIFKSKKEHYEFLLKRSSDFIEINDISNLKKLGFSNLNKNFKS